MNSVFLLSDWLVRFLNLPTYKHIVVCIMYLLVGLIGVYLYTLTYAVSIHASYINNLKRQSVLNFIHAYETNYTFTYADLYFTSKYCVELPQDDVLIKPYCNKILSLMYNNKLSK